jgi:RNA polymerase sigma-70 factor (ECF subfamily)
MTRPTVNPLVDALASGRPEGFGGLFDRLGRAMVRVAGVMLRSSGEAEDVVQDVFVELVRRRERLGLVRDIDAYVFAMLRNAVRRRVRGRERELWHLKRVAPVVVQGKENFWADELNRAMGSLPAEQREIIALKIDGGLTFAQIAEVLDLNPNTAASRYRYALEKLRRVLE